MPLFETIIHPAGAGGLLGDVIEGRPVDQPCAVTDVFGSPRDNWLGYHPAVDAAPLVEVAHYRAIAEGPLLWVGVGVPGPAGRNLNGGYGNVVLSGHLDGSQALGAHLRAFSPRIQAWIDAGYPPEGRPWLAQDEVIGEVGNTGFVFPAPVDEFDTWRGRHLHFECRDGGGGYVNPVDWMVDVDVLTPAPTPPASEPEPAPAPLHFGPVGAFNEARLVRRLFELLAEDPGSQTIEDVARMYEHEGAEIILALDGYVPEGIAGEEEALVGARDLAGWMHRLGALYTRTRPSVQDMAGTGAAIADSIVSVLRPVVAV